LSETIKNEAREQGNKLKKREVKNRKELEEKERGIAFTPLSLN